MLATAAIGRHTRAAHDRLAGPNRSTVDRLAWHRALFGHTRTRLCRLLLLFEAGNQIWPRRYYRTGGRFADNRASSPPLWLGSTQWLLSLLP